MMSTFEALSLMIGFGLLMVTLVLGIVGLIINSTKK